MESQTSPVRKDVAQIDLPIIKNTSEYFDNIKLSSGKRLLSAEPSSKKLRLVDSRDTVAETSSDESTVKDSRNFGASLLRDKNAAAVKSLSTKLLRCESNFYDVPCQDLAKRLLGCVLARRLHDGTVLRGRIVETECYLGGEDRASHSYNGRMTQRCKPMYMDPGTAYVYITYGMYHCFNISSQGPGAAVLLRALEPLEGIDFMLSQRLNARKKPRRYAGLNNHTPALSPEKVETLQLRDLCNGPAKLCTSLQIDKDSCNTRDLVHWDGMWVERGMDEVDEQRIVKTARIGINSAGEEWASKPLRFYLVDNEHVSKRDVLVEKEMRRLAELASFV